MQGAATACPTAIHPCAAGRTRKVSGWVSIGDLARGMQERTCNCGSAALEGAGKVGVSRGLPQLHHLAIAPEGDGRGDGNQKARCTSRLPDLTALQIHPLVTPDIPNMRPRRLVVRPGHAAAEY